MRDDMFHFFSYLFKLKYIKRWNLWKNNHDENVLEHTCEVAIIAHTLVTIQNIRYKGNLNADKAATLALFHETGETITGDIVTPIKHNNVELRTQFKKLEIIAAKRMCEQLPGYLQEIYNPIILNQEIYPEWPFVKAADKIAAYIKCLDEIKSGNNEFIKVKQTVYDVILALGIPAVKDFMIEFIPSLSFSLDELI
jgi:5'-deoxynucleotidase